MKLNNNTGTVTLWYKTEIWGHPDFKSHEFTSAEFVEFLERKLAPVDGSAKIMGISFSDDSFITEPETQDPNQNAPLQFELEQQYQIQKHLVEQLYHLKSYSTSKHSTLVKELSSTLDRIEYLEKELGIVYESEEKEN